MNTRTLLMVFAIVAATGLSYDCNAEDKRVTFGIDASARAEYDSNVGIVELDDSSGEPDRATVLAAGIDMSVKTSGQTSVRVGYDISDTSYQEFSQFDLGLHHAFAEVALNSRHFDAAVTADRYTGVLDGEQYLTVNQVSPSIAKLFGTRVYLRGAWIASSKDYDELAGRNADSTALRLDTYLLLDGMNRYLSLGLQTTSEDATDLELDYDSVQATLAYGHKVTLPLMELQLKAQLRYEQRDYLNVTESIGMRRQDKRTRGSLTAAIPFTDHIKLEGSVERTDNVSNLDAAVLDKLLYGLGLSVQF